MREKQTMASPSADILWADYHRKARFLLVVFELDFQFIITNGIIMSVTKYHKVYLY